VPLLVGPAILAVTICSGAMKAEVPVPYWSGVYADIIPIAAETVPVGEEVRIVGAGPAYTWSPEAIGAGLEQAGRIARMTAWHAPAVGDHRTVPPEAVMPTLLMLTGLAVEKPPDPATSRLLVAWDPVSPQERAEARELRGQLEQILRREGRVELIPPLMDAAEWLPLMAPTLHPKALTRYLRIASGPSKVPVALYALGPTTWHQ
jgi:hypothetical protein